MFLLFERIRLASRACDYDIFKTHMLDRTISLPVLQIFGSQVAFLQAYGNQYLLCLRCLSLTNAYTARK